VGWGRGDGDARTRVWGRGDVGTGRRGSVFGDVGRGDAWGRESGDAGTWDRGRGDRWDRGRLLYSRKAGKKVAINRSQKLISSNETAQTSTIFLSNHIDLSMTNNFLSGLLESLNCVHWDFQSMEPKLYKEKVNDISLKFTTNFSWNFYDFYRRNTILL